MTKTWKSAIFCAILAWGHDGALANTPYSLDIAKELKGQGNRSTVNSPPYNASPIKFQVSTNASTEITDKGLLTFAELGGVIMSSQNGGLFNLGSITLAGGPFIVSNRLDVWIYDLGNKSEVSPFVNNSNRFLSITLPPVGGTQIYDLGIKDAQFVFFRMGIGTFVINNVTGSVPEPTSWLLMISGFAMVGGAARYRRRATKVTYA